MFKVEYDTVAKMPDGSNGNVLQGKRTAYMDADFQELERVLEDHLEDSENPLHPIIIALTKIVGEIVQ